MPNELTGLETVTRGVPWVRSIGLAAAVSGFVVAYRVLRDRDRALLDD